jgi:hypothetical protein
MSRTLSLAGFPVTLIGRFWVTTEARETCFKNYERKRDAEVAPDLEPFGEEPNGPSNRRRPYILSNNATGAPAHEAGALHLET